MVDLSIAMLNYQRIHAVNLISHGTCSHIGFNYRLIGVEDGE